MIKAIEHPITVDSELDEALQSFVRRGDDLSFRKLMTTYQPMVAKLCRRILGRTAAADDAVQETFYKLSRHAGSITSKAGPWLYTCAINTALTARRTEITRKSRERAVVRVESRGLNADDRELVRECIAKLAREDRDVI